MYKILVVDDKLEIVKLLEIFFTKKGFEVVTALGGEKAIEILHSETKIDLMVLDMKMPLIRGMDVLKEMKKLNKGWPVIILSGSIDMEKYIKELKDLGYHQSHYLIKPVDLDLLLDTVKKILNPDFERDKC